MVLRGTCTSVRPCSFETHVETGRPQEGIKAAPFYSDRPEAPNRTLRWYAGRMAERSQRQITVLLVDDHAVVREGYRRLLERRGDIVVVGEAGTASEARALFCALDPTIVVMDITLPGISGIDSLREILGQKPDARVLVFSMHEEAIFARRALQTGAFGYLTKASAPDVLVEAVHAVAAGRKYVSADMARKLALPEVDLEALGADRLSVREFEVLRLLAQGRSVREIADSLGLHAKTVANHQSSIKQKLGADTALQLLIKANKLGMETMS
jgi:two-component system invasion response regulator UvrY